MNMESVANHDSSYFGLRGSKTSGEDPENEEMNMDFEDDESSGD